MRPGGGKHKGAAFERRTCAALSLWVTGGKRKDVFWRTAMSGGRATVRGLDVRQAGDICAVAPEGHAFCERYYVECKHLKNLDFQGLLRNTGKLYKIWMHTCNQASKRSQKPVLIAKQNGLPTILCWQEIWEDVHPALTMRWNDDKYDFHIYNLDDLLAQEYTLWAP
jgi:hypothetical protein